MITHSLLRPLLPWFWVDLWIISMLFHIKWKWAWRHDMPLGRFLSPWFACKRFSDVVGVRHRAELERCCSRWSWFKTWTSSCQWRRSTQPKGLRLRRGKRDHRWTQRFLRFTILEKSWTVCYAWWHLKLIKQLIMTAILGLFNPFPTLLCSDST